MFHYCEQIQYDLLFYKHLGMSILDMGYESTQEGYLRIYLHLKKKPTKQNLTPQGAGLHAELCSSMVRYKLIPFRFDTNY